MAETAQLVGQGNFHVKMHDTDAQDELGTVTRAFNTMEISLTYQLCCLCHIGKGNKHISGGLDEQKHSTGYNYCLLYTSSGVQSVTHQ